MNKTLKVFKYQISDNLRSVGIFYGIIVLIMALIALQTSMRTGRSMVSGMEMASVVFIFVTGLNSFKSSFKFMQMFGIPRRSFFAMTVLALLALAAGMTVVDLGLSTLFKLIMPYNSLFERFIHSSLGLQLLWEFALLIAAACVGLCINLLFYRSSKTLKIIIALSPVYLSLLLSPIARAVPKILEVIAFLLGFGSDLPAVNALGLAITALIALALSFLLVRRAPVKD